MPAWQANPPGHAMPHAPQFAGSLCAFTQRPAQVICVGAQLGTHDPPVQSCPAGHAVPHPPQWAPSVVGSTQVAPQSIRPSPQSMALEMHRPAAHICPAPQRAPQVPQLAESVCVSAHADPQATCGAVQVGGVVLFELQLDASASAASAAKNGEIRNDTKAPPAKGCGVFAHQVPRVNGARRVVRSRPSKS